MQNLSGKHVLVLGLGQTGVSCVRWLLAQEARVRAADSRSAPPGRDQVAALPDVSIETGEFDAGLFAGIDLVVASPGIDLRQPLLQQQRAQGMEFVGDVELFARQLNGLSAQPMAIGITGSNGKSTVTTMVGDMCRAAGLRAVVAGNIGLPVLDTLGEAARGDVVVLELSSFQLETTSSLNLNAATLLNISEDHLDRYDGVVEYAQAKARIFNRCGRRVLNRQDGWSFALARPSDFSFGLDAPDAPTSWGLLQHDGHTWLAQGAERLLAVDQMPVTGLHNAANALAALALCRAIDLPYEPLLEALRRFKGLPHRVEAVLEIDGVGFYDDSKGTNVGATVAALNGMSRKVVLIAGGDGKGQDFNPLAAAVAARARAVVLIGRDAPLIETALRDCGVPCVRAQDMAHAVLRSHALARRGDAVLLSPACASFDMFRNYGHRAQVFVEAVHALARASAQQTSKGALQ